jgi:hypothetical protein
MMAKHLSGREIGQEPHSVRKTHKFSKKVKEWFLTISRVGSGDPTYYG